jgi:Xaa-Pro aminopeptidase
MERKRPLTGKMRTFGMIGSVVGLMLSLQTASAAGLFDNKEYAARRSRLMEKIPDGAAVFLGAPAPAGDVDFRQGHDFSYFTGVEVPDACLIIDGVRKESILFFTVSEGEAAGDGIPLDLVRDPKAATGIEKVLPADRFGAYLTDLSRRTQTLYTMFKPEELGPENANEKFNVLQRTMTLNLWDGRLTRELQFVKRLRETFPQADVRDCAALVWDLRKIKSPAEIAVTRRAGSIGVAAHDALIRSTRPGVPENDLASVFEFVCRKEGAQALAYETILMSGKNHAYGHYHKHDRVLAAGDFVILDAGPDYGNYHVDISTSFPASGKFSARQKELYEVALAVRKVCLDNYRPGATFRRIGEKVASFLRENGLDKYAPLVRGTTTYGGYNHSVGMATHDVMGTFAGPDEVLAPGFVFACDIQVFRVEEEIGIRVEDTIAITEDGYENLSLGVPRTVAEIEALMKKDGILQVLGEKGLDGPKSRP